MPEEGSEHTPAGAGRDIVHLRSRRQSWSSASSHSLPRLVSSSLHKLMEDVVIFKAGIKAISFVQPSMFPPFTFLKITARQFLAPQADILRASPLLCSIPAAALASSKLKTERVRPPQCKSHKLPFVLSTWLSLSPLFNRFSLASSSWLSVARAAGGFSKRILRIPSCCTAVKYIPKI